MKKFCPICGRESILVCGLCKDCFLKRKKPLELPLLVEFEQCKNCMKVKFKGRMVVFDEEFFKGIVLQNLRNKLFDSYSVERIDFFEKQNAWKAVVKVKGKIGKASLALNVEVLLKPKMVLCDACMRLSSGYYQAVLQLRFSGKNYFERMERKIQEAEEFLLELSEKDSLSKIVKVLKVSNGVDLQIGSKRAARLLAEKFAKESKEKIAVSSSLAGVDRKGHEWSRFTYCVRF